MRLSLSLALIALLSSAPALAAPASRILDPATGGYLGMAADRTAALLQLAQSDCRGQCSSSRGYCLSTCHDSFCRAVCNDRYQSCLSSCRR